MAALAVVLVLVIATGVGASRGSSESAAPPTEGVPSHGAPAPLLANTGSDYEAILNSLLAYGLWSAANPEKADLARVYTAGTSARRSAVASAKQLVSQGAFVAVDAHTLRSYALKIEPNSVWLKSTERQINRRGVAVISGAVIGQPANVTTIRLLRLHRDPVGRWTIAESAGGTKDEAGWSWFVGIFVLLAAAAILTSLVQFARQSLGDERRFLALVATLFTGFVLSIYYASTIATVFARLGRQPDSVFQALANAFMWWQDFWLRGVAASIGPFSVVSDFSPSAWPFVILFLCYFVRLSVFTFLRERAESLEQLTSSYWAGITAVVVTLACANGIYGLDAWAVVAVTVTVFLVTGTLLVRLVGDVVSALVELGHYLVSLIKTIWKNVAIAATVIASFFRGVRERVYVAYDKMVAEPLERLGSWIEEKLAIFDEATNDRIDRREQSERDRKPSERRERRRQRRRERRKSGGRDEVIDLDEDQPQDTFTPS